MSNEPVVTSFADARMPQEGDPITVIIILPDGSRLETTGVFGSAEWSNDYVEEPGLSWEHHCREFRKVETRFSLHLRHAEERRVSPEVTQGPRRIEP